MTRAWKKFVTGWDWWDTVTGAFFGLCAGAVSVHLLHVYEVVEP